MTSAFNASNIPVEAQEQGHPVLIEAMPARDGYLVVAVFAEKFWSGFCRALERPDLERDPRFASNVDRVANKAALVPALEAAFRARTVTEWLEALRREGVPPRRSMRSIGWSRTRRCATARWWPRCPIPSWDRRC